MSNEISENTRFILHKKKEIASVDMGSLVVELTQGILSITLFYFYEQILGLNAMLVGIAIAIYAIYDAFNDPLIGFLTDRVFPWTKKWGRRFPFIMVSYIPMLITFLMIFSPPVFTVGNEMALFGWLVFSTCLFDTVESVFTINFWALLPDKFRDQDERKILGIFEVALGFVGVAISFVLPMLVLEEEIASEYATLAWVCVIISLVAYIFLIPGIREDQETIDKYLNNPAQKEKDSFFDSLKLVLKQRNFRAYLIIYILYQAMIQLMQGSMFYYTKFVLGFEDAETILLVMFFLGGLIAIPIWNKYTKKTGDKRKTWLISASMMATFSVILTLMTTLEGAMILIVLYGTGFGGFWITTTPIYTDIIDEAVIRDGKRKEGIYGGFSQLFINLARVIQAMTIAIVHTLTDFQEGSDTQGALAIFGIQIHFALLPGIYLFIGIFFFWKFYDLTKEKIEINKQKLMDLSI
ncbi:MAG: MFS transporter [archaeon]|nr:MFS transporter [archaeon]